MNKKMLRKYANLLVERGVNVQKDQLDTRLPSLGNCRPTSRCFMSETWSWGNHCLCSI